MRCQVSAAYYSNRSWELSNTLHPYNYNYNYCLISGDGITDSITDSIKEIKQFRSLVCFMKPDWFTEI